MGPRKQTRRTIAILGAGLACLLSGTPAQAATRSADPVVVTGADVPSLVGVAPASVVAFSRSGGQWVQVPVQVDERAMVDLATVYGLAPNGVTTLTYTDPNTFTGPDPDPKLDSDDEIAMMARDAGDRYPGGVDPAGTVAGSGVEVRVADPLGGAPTYAYLYRTDGSLAPGAGKQYVSYTFDLLSGDYKSTYRRGRAGSPNGPNPENSSVVTPNYTDHFSDRWVQDGMKITTPGASGVNILDRHKNLFAPGNCGRSENTFSAEEGAFIANKSGPVRAIRSFVGANSGPWTQRTETFYDARQDIRTNLRVHTIGVIMDFFDYSPAATGMRYSNNLNQAGVTIDGVPDTVTEGSSPVEQVSGPQGGLSMYSAMDTDMTLNLTSYYLDDNTPPVTQCTGDAFAYGSSGSWVTSGIDNTDPTLGPPTHRLVADRTIYFEKPGAVYADAAARAEGVTHPLAATTGPIGGRVATRLDLRLHRGKKRNRLSGAICGTTDLAPTVVLQRRTKKGAFVRIRGLRLTLADSGCWKLDTTVPGKPGAYRVKIAEDAERTAATSRTLRIRRR